MALEKHRSIVERISSKTRDFHQKGASPKLYHGSTKSTNLEDIKEDNKIHLENLDRVLEVDEEDEIAIVEPNVRMDELVDATLEKDLFPPVVMEFPGITVGGGIAGGSGESSSFEEGLFHHIFESLEVVLPNGEVVTASRDENSELFYSIPGSYGSLGIITKAEIRLREAKDYVELEYIPFGSFEDGINLLKEECKNNHDFIDGIIFNKNFGVVITGSLVEEPGDSVSRFTRARDDWFYHQIKEKADREDVVKDYAPLKDYLFRYDRGGFWAGNLVFDEYGLPNPRIIRSVADPLFYTENLYQALHESNFSQKWTVQDTCMPVENTTEYLNWLDENMEVFPLWLCPIKPDENYPLSPSQINTDLVVNIGVWGITPDGEDYMDLNKRLEERVKDLEGRKTLYAEHYYEKKDFWDIYNKKKYKEVREKFSATKLPDVHSKTYVDEEYELKFWKGLLKWISPPYKK